jgi:hypothetical protein
MGFPLPAASRAASALAMFASRVAHDLQALASAVFGAPHAQTVSPVTPALRAARSQLRHRFASGSLTMPHAQILLPSLFWRAAFRFSARHVLQ